MPAETLPIQPGDWSTLSQYLATIAPVVNVKDPAFGAKGNGTTDDTAAIQAAINAAGTTGAVVAFPPGIYLVSAQLNVTASNLTFQGAGRYAAILKKANNTNIRVFSLTAATGCVFRDLGFDLNGTVNASGPYGIWMDAACDNAIVERCNFFNADGFTVFVFGGPTSRVANLRIVNSDFTQLAGATHDLVTVISQGGAVYGCRFNHGGNQAGLNMYEGNDMIVAGNTFTSNGGGNALCVISSCFRTTVVGNTMVCGTADEAIRLIVETDNGGAARNSQDTVIANNTVLMVATGNSKGVKINAAGKAVLNTQIIGNVFDTAQFAIYYEGGTITGVGVADNRIVGGGNVFGNNVVPTGHVYHHNAGYNPVGNIAVGAAPLAPAVPATTVAATNVTGVDCVVRVIAGAATVSAVSVGATALTGVTVGTGTTSGEIRVPAGQTITLTYSGGTPTWQWFGD